jgi:uncharacterized protein
MQIKDKVIVLTGAASGIGAALLDDLSAFRCHIIAVDIAPMDTLPSGNATIQTMQADLSQPEDIDRLFDTIGHIDIFIANAGFAYYEHTPPADWQRIERLYRLNVFSPLYTLAKLQERNTPFHLVITASGMSRFAVAGYAHYSATKAALDRFAQAHRSLLPKGSHLTLVYPIATQTQFFKNDNNQAPLLYPNQTPAYVAGRIRRGIQRNAKEVHPSPGFIVFLQIGKVMPGVYWLYHRYSLWMLKRNLS